MPSKLELLLEKEAQLKAQIQLAKATERTLEKKKDTRRKILIGAAVMARVNNGEWPQHDLLMMMDGFLTRPNERELFGLETDEGEAEQPKAKQHQVRSQEPMSTAKADAKKPADTTALKKGAAKKPKTLPEPADDFADQFKL